MDKDRRAVLYGDASADGVAMMAVWLARPEVRPAVEMARPTVAALVAPLDAHLPDQVSVCHLAMRIADPVGLGVLLPDGSSDTTPLAVRWDLGAYHDPRPWVRELGQIRVRMVAYRVARLAEIVARAADYLAATGVPIQPHQTDRYVLAELLLLEAVDGFTVPWDDGAQAVAEMLQPGGVVTVSLDGRTATHRDGSDRSGQRGEAIRADWRKQVDAAPPTTPYAHGKRRQTRADTIARRDALAKVLVDHPAATATSLRAEWRTGSADKTAGGKLREYVHNYFRGHPTYYPLPECPGRSTLATDLKFLRDGKNLSQ